MSGLGFYTALSALTTAQSALSIIGNNIANASTPGYTRQRVGLDSMPAIVTSRGFQIGRGVEIDAIDRVTDALLVDRLRSQEAEVGRFSVLSDHYRQIESLFGEPGPNGLSSLMGGFFADVSGLTSAPEDPALRTQLIQSGRTLSDGFNTVASQLLSFGHGVGEAVETEVMIINAIAAELASLNNSIAETGMGPSIPSDLLDRQETLLRELGQHIDVRAVREADGRITAFSGGNVLVSPRGASQFEAFLDDPVTGKMGVRSTGATTDVTPRGGRIRALLDLSEEGIDQRLDGLNTLARNLILEANRVHSTGVPLGGGYKTLASRNYFYDANGNGDPLDDRLDQAELPFDVSAGTLNVNVSDLATGDVSQHRIVIDPSMTVQDFVDELQAIPNLSASVDPLGQMRITALGNRRFDFSNRVPPNPNLDDTFGAERATIVATQAGPYGLAAGDSFTIDIDGQGPTAVTFNAGQFADISQATPAEVAAAINSQIVGASAEVSDGRVVLRSNSTNGTGSLELADGAGGPLATMGLSTTLETGGDAGVQVTMSGGHLGSEDLDLTFVPVGAGAIGFTPGLQVSVLDASGAIVATLDVGDSYTPGKDLEIQPGVSVSFSAGDISAASGDRFATRLVADSDTSDILVAAGLGGFFVGSDASSIGIDPELLADPDRLAAALDGSAGNNQNLLRLSAVYETAATGLDGDSPDEFYRLLITQLGADAQRADQTLGTQQLVLDSLDARREEISGVNIDEELLELERFQQMYAVAARFLQTMQEVNDILVSL